MSESISQAEIDALIRGELGGGALAGAPTGGPSPAVLERLSTMLQAASASSGALFGDALGVGSLSGEQTSAAGVLGGLPGPALAVSLTFAQGLPGRGYLILPEALAASMVGRASGGMPPLEWTPDVQGALAEIVSQLLGAGLTALSVQVGRSISLGLLSCAVLPHNLPEDLDLTEPLVQVRFSLFLAESEGNASLLLTPDLARSLDNEPPRAAPAIDYAAMAFGAAAPQAPAPSYRAPAPSPAPAQTFGLAAAAAQPLAVQRVDFPDFGNPAQVTGEARNIELILDVSLQVTVELGRTRKQIRDVLALGPGSVVELDKLAGEAVDVLVNGKLIAKGEVVVVDDNFGVRITDIISPAERAASLR